ncbi:hypothetical protein SL053_002009 [Flavobacterium psychrophilum]|uniref:hypothetical protein n=1 Tax=Flavobacterium psychrophilum TaxID=96345 RepID=UPI00054C3048|nr:hypothetical protein [Flavobacterium psychrophilum]EKT3963518.1 hypothetical protein [Flavobacterium psychrophilum]EKT4497615.1 hypothetical protein [Flavobacterium psychrophilum]EKT4501013.1 hypothetical protein [Flavobacterium psychrophilum]EKT4517972.1 hypothetical protein [Flavobacterium psychrophilum]EKT4520371.1 hypothetical protein [Flavobacterium psychrophilum]
MKTTKLKFITFFLFISVSYTNSFAQGCSDAGFCSLGKGFNPHEANIKNSVDLGVVYGIAEEGVTVFSQYLTYTRELTDQFAISTKLTSAIANGDFGTRGNIGDLFLTGNYKFKNKFSNLEGSKTWSLLFGFKIPLTNSNDKINTVSLPMAYQASLGTFDFIGGVNLTYKKWDFNTAVQIPLSDNKNSYISNPLITDKFATTNLFERKSDVLFRTTYKVKTTNEKFTFKPNLLFIYHLGEDNFTNIFGQRETIVGSDGLTINSNLIVSYKLNKKSYLETSIASPFVVRKERPDGLTRVLTLGLSYKVNF